MSNKSLFGLLIILLTNIQSYSQICKFETMFVLNFTKNIELSQNIDEYVIYVVNYDELSETLKELSSAKKLGALSYKIESVHNYTDIKGTPSMIIVGQSSSGQIGKIARKFNAVIVSMKSNQCWEGGAHISFVNIRGKMKYEVSKTNFTNDGFKISYKLLNLAHAVF